MLKARPFLLIAGIAALAALQAQDLGYTYKSLHTTTDRQTVLYVPAITDNGAVIVRSVRTEFGPPVSITTEVLQYNPNGEVVTILPPSDTKTVGDVSPKGAVLLVEKVKGEPLRVSVWKDGEETALINTADSEFASFGCGALNEDLIVGFAGLRDSGISGFFELDAAAPGSSPAVRAEETELPDLSSQLCSQASKLRFNQAKAMVSVSGTDSRPLLIHPDLGVKSIGYADSRYGAVTYLANEVAMSANGTVVFGGSIGVDTGLGTGALFRSVNGEPATLVVATKGTNLPSPRLVAMNDREDVVYFETGPGNVTAGIPVVFLDRMQKIAGGVGQPQTILKVGDPLFESVIAGLGFPNFTITPRYINNRGQIAFQYTLLNGTRGIGLAALKE